MKPTIFLSGRSDRPFGDRRRWFGRDPETGDVCGIYFFDSAESLSQFKESELAESIAQAYEAVDVRREVYNVLYSLRPERGPLSDVAR